MVVNGILKWRQVTLANLTSADIIRSHISAALAKLFTSLPARVESYDNKTRTITAVPLIRRVYSDGASQGNQILEDIPVMFPSAGGAEVTLPVKKGDTVLLVFSMRNMQDWLISGGQEELAPAFRRNHDINDAIAIPGLFTKNSGKTANPDDLEIIFGDSKIKVQKDAKIIIDSGSVELGEGATESVVLGDGLKSYLDGHTHTYTPPSTGTPLQTSPPSSAPGVPDLMPNSTLSDFIKVK